MPGPYATRADELRALRRKTPRYRVPFPDLSVEERTSPCSNVIATSMTLTARTLPVDAHRFPIGHSHKQGLELITPGMIANGELQWMSGKKS